VLILFLGGMAAAQSAQPAPPAGFRIAGTIVHADTSQPVANAQLSIIRAQTPDLVQTTQADDGGHFFFLGVAAGKYVLVAQTRGFPRQAWDEHLGFSTAVAVGREKDSENIVFRMRPEASISGSVVDDAGDPVREGQVMLFHRATEEGNAAVHLREQISTDDQGHYHFAHLFPGTYFVVVSAHPWYAQPMMEGIKNAARDVTFPLTYYSGTSDPNGAMPITIKSGDKAIADFSLVPVPALRLEITGPVIAQESISLFATQKVFGEMSLGTPGQSERTSDGRMFLSGLPAGEIEINGSSQGRNWKKSTQLSASGVLKIAAIPSSLVAGTAILDGSKFHSGVVELVPQSAGQRLAAGLNPDGAFEFSGESIAPGPYKVEVRNLFGAVLSSVAATGAKVDGYTIQIAEASTVTLKLMLSKGVGQLNGTALSDGKPAPGAMIVLLPRDLANNLSLIRRDQSDSDGTFTLPQIAPGSYTVLALRNGWEMEWQNPTVLQPYLKSGKSFIVEPNQRYQMEVNVQ
jgi:hypothetical protein